MPMTSRIMKLGKNFISSLQRGLGARAASCGASGPSSSQASPRGRTKISSPRTWTSKASSGPGGGPEMLRTFRAYLPLWQALARSDSRDGIRYRMTGKMKATVVAKKLLHQQHFNDTFAPYRRTVPWGDRTLITHGS